MNPALFLQLDRTIHEKGRLAIVSMLAASPGLSFTEMRGMLGMTDGNFTAHIRALQQAGYVAITKLVKDGRKRTTFALTSAGETAFKSYLALLEQIVEQIRE